MKLRSGTSGFSYPAWRGPFYPPDLPAHGMLRFYAERLPTVEINNTFYRMPKASILEGWARQVPDAFRFVIKTPRRITHAKDRESAGASLSHFVSVAAVLGERLGALLFQLPPYRRREAELLDALLGRVPAGVRAAFEFRHRSWFVDETYTRLREADAALVAADFDDPEQAAPLVRTAPFGYARLRASAYDDRALGAWLRRLREEDFDEIFLFFKHEEEGVAPLLAQRILAIARAEGDRASS